MIVSQRITYALSLCAKELCKPVSTIFTNIKTSKLKTSDKNSGDNQYVVLQQVLSRASCTLKQAFKIKIKPTHCDIRNKTNEIFSAASNVNHYEEGKHHDPVVKACMYVHNTGSLSKSETDSGRRKFSTSSTDNLPSSFSGPSNPCAFDIIVIGAGIVGTATARELSIRYPTFKIALIEKESEVSVHQSHNNAGVIHAGIYYPPNSKYAKLCVRGCELMYKYCDDNDIPYDRNGKLIVAVHPSECQELLNLFRNASSNKVVGIRMVGKDGIQKIEPHCVGIRALHSPNTGVVSYKKVTESLAQDFQNNGGQIYFDLQVEGFGRNMSESECCRKMYPLCIFGSKRCLNAKYAVVCAGLYADRLAMNMGGKRAPMILPVRGNFFKLKPEHAHLVNGNIYPVPQKNNPFPGVHLTKGVDGMVKCGPSAVLAMHREGYNWYKLSPRDLADMVTFIGFYKAPLAFGTSAWVELLAALSKKMQVRLLRKYIPEIKESYIQKAPPGVAALALTSGGILEKDLIFEVSDQKGMDEVVRRVLHVRSAPSPAATSSLAIAEAIVEKVHNVFLVKTLPPPKKPHFIKSACDYS